MYIHSYCYLLPYFFWNRSECACVLRCRWRRRLNHVSSLYRLRPMANWIVTTYSLCENYNCLISLNTFVKILMFQLPFLFTRYIYFFLVFSAFQVAPSFIIEKKNRSIYITFCYILLNNIHLFVRLNQMWHIISMLGLGNQWKEGSQPASPLNVAIVAPHTWERYIWYIFLLFHMHKKINV